MLNLYSEIRIQQEDRLTKITLTLDENKSIRECNFRTRVTIPSAVESIVSCKKIGAQKNTLGAVRYSVDVAMSNVPFL